MSTKTKPQPLPELPEQRRDNDQIVHDLAKLLDLLKIGRATSRPTTELVTLIEGLSLDTHDASMEALAEGSPLVAGAFAEAHALISQVVAPAIYSTKDHPFVGVVIVFDHACQWLQAIEAAREAWRKTSLAMISGSPKMLAALEAIWGHVPMSDPSTTKPGPRGGRPRKAS